MQGISRMQIATKAYARYYKKVDPLICMKQFRHLPMSLYELCALYIWMYKNKLLETSLLPPFSTFNGPFADFKFSQRFKRSRHSSHWMHFIESGQGGFLLDACKPLKHLNENSWAGRKHEVLMTLKYFTPLSVGGDNQRKKFILAFSNCRYQPEMLMSIRLDF